MSSFAGCVSRCKNAAIGASLGAAMAAISTTPAVAMALPYISEVIMTGADYCPVGWLPADGRTLPISEYEDLFTLIGITYGGDGEAAFNLPMVDPIRTASGATLLPCIAFTGIFPPMN